MTPSLPTGAPARRSKAFEAECGCELKFVALEDGVSLLNRLRMEGKTARPTSCLALITTCWKAAAQSKLFAKSNVPASAVSVPGGWDNDTFVPYDYGYFAFVYDKKNKLANPPKSLKELVEGPQNGGSSMKIRVPAPGTGPAAVDAKGLWRSSARGPAEAGRENRYRHQRLERSLWSVPERGKRPVLSYTTSPAYHMIEEKKDNYAAASFAEGHYLQVEVAARTAASKQPELAEKFLKFMVSPGFQNAIPTGNWMYPVTKVTLPAGFDTL